MLLDMVTTLMNDKKKFEQERAIFQSKERELQADLQRVREEKNVLQTQNQLLQKQLTEFFANQPQRMNALHQQQFQAGDQQYQGYAHFQQQQQAQPVSLWNQTQADPQLMPQQQQAQPVGLWNQTQTDPQPQQQQAQQAGLWNQTQTDPQLMPQQQQTQQAGLWNQTQTDPQPQPQQQASHTPSMDRGVFPHSKSGKRKLQ